VRAPASTLEPRTLLQVVAMKRAILANAPPPVTAGLSAGNAQRCT